MSLNKYILTCRSYKDSRWAAIGLSNLADTVPLVDIPRGLPLARQVAVEQITAKLAMLRELRPPQIILDLASKVIEKAQSGKDIREATLRRSAKRRSLIALD